ncbi:hypothetical protein P154DRAFT_530764 [Amniculicola lignicola CBS 123094]|uniref:Plasma membrane fusion protein PRM1 n=1 Tax=Amniculicola lignicola CBS 123094 TaxID=1392246 RepID=A0A6A5X0Y2_9PLEO|nr:hypothetical protein P154DRAFT_530764 [Amniculicola lignicola CBS 123094]
MASTVNQQQPFPAVPPSLSAGDHEMRDYYAPQTASRPTINQTPYLKPYLGLRARLSQIWLNRWTILLLLVLIRVLFAIASTEDSLSSARREALSACTQVENIGSSMASMPHYMSQGINELTATGVEKAVSGLMKMLDMSVTGVEQIIIFIIDMLTSTYLCLITLAVRGGVGAALEVTKDMTESVNKGIDDVAGDLGKKVDDFNNLVKETWDKIFSVPSALSPPTLNLNDQINKLKDVEVSPKMQEGLQKLNASLPTFDDVRAALHDLISKPFEEVKGKISEMDKFEFDRKLLPVPQKEQLNFCSEGNALNNFFDDLLELAYKSRKIFLAVLIVLAILVIIPMWYTEVRRYHRMEQRAQLFNEGHDAMDVVYLASRPHSSSLGLWLGKRFGSTRQQAIVRWTWAYATSIPMMFLISLGIAGLFSCLCQFILFRSIQAKAPELTDQVADFAEKVVNSLNNASMSWSGGVNGALSSLDEGINKDVLGWVDTSTTAVNNTLNSFVDQMNKKLEDALGDTPLHDAVQDLLRCLVGLKIEGFQKAITWVKDNAKINFPGVKNDTFSLGALAQKSGSSSAAELLANPNGKTKDEVTEAVNHVIDKLLSGIRTEALISTGLILIWLSVTIGAIIYACIQLSRHQPLSLEAGDAYNIDPATHDQEPKVQAYPETAAPPYEYQVNKEAPYTLPARPFPTFEPLVTNAQNETVGRVGAHTVSESARPGHLRASSHGHLADPSPSDEKQNPFVSPIESKRNPFNFHEDEKRNPFAD